MEADHAEISQARTISIINLILGIWLIIAPYALSYQTTAAYWSEVVTGILVIIFSLVRLAVPKLAWPSWLNGLAGVWLIISPFILSYAGTASYWNQIIFGVIVAILGFSNVGSVQHHHGHQGHPA